MGGEAMTIIDHAGLRVTDFGRARDFYTASLGTLGIQLLAEFEAGGKRHAGYGDKDGPTFWIDEGKLVPGEAHIAFVARSRAEVRAFHMTALANGGRDNGPPGLRPEYSAHYFAAFVLDPDGHNIEAVCVGPGEGSS
jgi:catechol 2,3-dioxygenase-like lactoylglutathione lyase family enzyme